jgi:hypothetical protein
MDGLEPCEQVFVKPGPFKPGPFIPAMNDGAFWPHLCKRLGDHRFDARVSHLTEEGKRAAEAQR